MDMKAAVNYDGLCNSCGNREKKLFRPAKCKEGIIKLGQPLNAIACSHYEGKKATWKVW